MSQYTYLFFDDVRLSVRSNMERKLGTPQLLPEGELKDPSRLAMCAGFPGVFFDEETDTYRMLECSWTPESKIIVQLAESKDGIHWGMVDTRELFPDLKNRLTPYQVLPWYDGELGKVLMDPTAPPAERYKLLMANYLKEKMDTEKRILDTVWVSPDLLHWKLKEESTGWHPVGAEPGMGAFYNSVRDSIVISVRPDWGERRITVMETRDWVHFSEPELAVQPDSLDTPLAETYGMPVFAYDNYFIGFLWLYYSPDTHFKFVQGHVNAQLVYSINGWHFQRTLRQPFVPNGTPGQPTAGCVYPSSLVTAPDGNLFIHASASTKEHGYFTLPGQGSVVTYSLRKDGFIYLESNGLGRVRTRSMVWHGGEAAMNIQCPDGEARCSITTYDGQEMAGYAFEDCVPFAGDSHAWVPEWHNGKKLEDLTGQNICLEISLSNGRLYAIRGNCTPLMYSEGERFNSFGKIPDRKGF